MCAFSIVGEIVVHQVIIYVFGGYSTKPANNQILQLAVVIINFLNSKRTTSVFNLQVYEYVAN